MAVYKKLLQHKLIVIFWLTISLAQLISSASAAVVLNAIKTGTYTSEGTWVTPEYTTGITFAYGPEARGMVVFDVRSLPAGTIQSAVLSLQNPYTVNEPGGSLELRLYGLTYMDSYNYTGNYYLNLSNFTLIDDGAKPRWGTAFVTPVSWPGSTVTFNLPDEALVALRQAADWTGPGYPSSGFVGDFFAFGLRVVKADAEEPKPLQYVFGGTAASGQVQLSIELTPVPLPAAGWLLSAGLGAIAWTRRQRSVRHSTG